MSKKTAFKQSDYYVNIVNFLGLLTDDVNIAIMEFNEFYSDYFAVFEGPKSEVDMYMYDATQSVDRVELEDNVLKIYI